MSRLAVTGSRRNLVGGQAQAQHYLTAHDTPKYGGYDLTKLPRHKFVESGVGCVTHADPNCLCDVTITKPCEAKQVPLFGELAEVAVGDVSAETLHEWASILVGCHEQWLPLEQEEDVPEVHGWALLPEYNRQMLVASYRNKVRWSEARVWVPSWFPKEDFKMVARTYNIRLFTPSLHNKEQ